MSFKVTNKATTFITICGRQLAQGESIIIDAITYAEWQETLDHLKFCEVITIEQNDKESENKIVMASEEATNESPELDS